MEQFLGRTAELRAYFKSEFEEIVLVLGFWAGFEDENESKDTSIVSDARKRRTNW